MFLFFKILNTHFSIPDVHIPKKLFYGNDAKFQESMKNMLSHVPLGRPANTEEIAHAALFLAAPETSYITGHVLVVDGGWTAGYIRDF